MIEDVFPQGGKISGAYLTEVQSRCFHVSPLIAAAARVAMSKFDPEAYLPYDRLLKNLEVVKKRLNRPLTLSEKILYSHIDNAQSQVSTYVVCIYYLCFYVTITNKVLNKKV